MTFLLALSLSLSGIFPGGFMLPKDALIMDETSISLDASALQLSVDLGHRGTALDEIGAVVGRGIALGSLAIGVEGVPPGPFVSNFLSANEIRITQVDPESIASSLMLQVRLTLD